MITGRPIWEASGMPLRRFRETIKASTKTVHRALNSPISVSTADRWCHRIGKHPAEVYGTAIWIAALEGSHA